MALHPNFPESPYAIQWCEDINRVQSNTRWDFVDVDEAGFERYPPTSFQQLVSGFREYRVGG